MSYNRLDPTGHGQDDYYDMNNRQQLAAPSRVSTRRCAIPMGPGGYRVGTPSDQLQAQPSYSVEHIDQSQYHQRMPLNQSQSYDSEYSLDPNAHHDAYFQPPYQPQAQAQDPYGYADDDDHQPILQSHEPYGPDPHTASGIEYKGYDGAHGPSPTETPVPQLRRYKTVKEVQLFNGNLVLDCPIPPKLLNQVNHAPPPERDEFTHMRYSAATCDPSEFFEERFTLRQKAFCKASAYRTLYRCYHNVEFMCSRKDSKTWGKDAWKKIVVCIVSDGRAKINPRTRAVLAGLGVYQDGIAKQQVNGKDVTAHIYEYTTQVGISLKKDIVELRPKQQPINYFSAFGRVLDPNICVLLDAGTKPGKDSIYHLWKAFDLEPTCAGACGEIKAMLGPGGKNLLNPLVATQNFEYKMSNILDKPLESAFGFISDRILCFELVSKRNCHWILQYVKSATGETDVPDTMAELILQRRRWLNGSFFAAIYALAHFYEIFRSDHSFLRKVMFLIEFTYQTINMIFAWFALGNFFLVFHILTTSLGGDDLLGKVGVILGVVFEWLYLFTLLTCFILALGNRPQGTNKVYMSMVYFWIIIMIYLMFASIFITVKSIQTQLAKDQFNWTDIIKNQIFYTLIISLASTYLLWFISSFIFFDPWHMFTSFFQYLLLTPTYINILNVYAFCNTHDITWGTKGDDKAEKLPSAVLKAGGKVDVNIPTDDGDLNAQYESEMRKIQSKAPPEKREFSAEEKQEDYYKWFRSSVVLFWLVCNFALTSAVLSTAGLEKIDTSTDDTTKSTIYMAVVLWSVAGLKYIQVYRSDVVFDRENV
ncbi:hypothetical protein EYC84_001259 [Monilinia fructicola]|uniref:Chitin synthase n=1 Tax=Monilinia fructicola TaxID=38448 RepID=A0A5M9JPE3_MONFR|nr:hypothetical protein EYC84_001259 [Monilinia fructicola]